MAAQIKISDIVTPPTDGSAMPHTQSANISIRKSENGVIMQVSAKSGMKEYGFAGTPAEIAEEINSVLIDVVEA